VYVNAKMIHVETVPEIEGGMKESSGCVGGGEFKYDTFDTF
jgi:hypothetical protein